MIQDGDRIKRVPSAAWREIDGQVAIISTSENRLRVLNPVAGFIWSRCADKTVSELVEEVCTSFSVDRTTASKDIEHFLGELEQMGLIERA